MDASHLNACECILIFRHSTKIVPINFFLNIKNKIKLCIYKSRYTTLLKAFVYDLCKYCIGKKKAICN